MEERSSEFFTATEIAQQVGDREAAGLVEQAARREGARRIGELRLAAREPAEVCLGRTILPAKCDGSCANRGEPFWRSTARDS